MKKYISTIVAIILGLIVAFAPEPFALPLDPIAKGLVVLAVFAGVYYVEGAITRRKEDKPE